MGMPVVAEIKNYTLNFVSGRPMALTCVARTLACNEIELNRAGFTFVPSREGC
jgi:hypothetical protein